MSFEGQVLCQRMLIGPVELATAGAPGFCCAWASSGSAPSAAPVVAAARVKNVRREVLVCCDSLLDGFFIVSS
jgi:hypothetical protein